MTDPGAMDIEAREVVKALGLKCTKRNIRIVAEALTKARNDMERCYGQPHE